MKNQFTALSLAILLALAAVGLSSATTAAVRTAPILMAQAMVPPTGMDDDEKPATMEDRMKDRFPQPVRVGDLIGLPVLDMNASTLGTVREVVKTPKGKIQLIVGYSRWWGWFGRPVAVPIEVVGIEGRQLVSLDMPPKEYAAAPTWQAKDAAAIPAGESIEIALARN
jgi:sporulation protein YlmC with PRC-barrel domain